MYPYKIFFGLDLYSIFILVGIVVCLIFIRVLSDRRKLRAIWQNLCLFNTLLAVVLGYGSAVLFQAFYNYMENGGEFTLANDTGATFYGGLIGGTLMFIIIYFVAGHFLFPKGYHKKHFRDASDMAAPCITVAHGLGRLGCLMAGCCHGKETDAWYGIRMCVSTEPEVWKTCVPVQLFEAIFLLAFSALLFLAFWERKRYLLPTYMVGYSLWRFVAERMRDDDRGATIVDFLTPSQLISVLLLAGGLLLLAVEVYVDVRAKRKAEALVAAAPSADAEDDAHETDESSL